MNLSRKFRNAFGAAVLGTAIFTGAAFLSPTPAHARVFVSVAIAPPAIPVYTQPVMPGDGYIWTPGYWAWTGEGYEWVNGAWVMPPYVGALWTPGYWGYGPGGYFWNAGYWGPTIGYYGGINYGFGYFGVGFYGGYWRGGHFWYNRCYNTFRPGWHGGYAYNRPYAGHFDGRPGGSSWSNHGSNFAGNRGSYYNNRGNSFAQATRNGFGNRGMTNVSASRNYSNGFNNAGRQGFAQNNSFRGANSTQRSFASSQSFGNRGSFGNQSMAYRGNQGFGNRGSFSAPQSHTSFGGGGFHGNSAGSFGGSRGGFGGGGGGGFHGGGGGGFHGGGGHR